MTDRMNLDGLQTDLLLGMSKQAEIAVLNAMKGLVAIAPPMARPALVIHVAYVMAMYAAIEIRRAGLAAKGETPSAEDMGAETIYPLVNKMTAAWAKAPDMRAVDLAVADILEGEGLTVAIAQRKKKGASDADA